MSTTTNHLESHRDPASLVALLASYSSEDGAYEGLSRFSDLGRMASRDLAREWHRLPVGTRRRLVQRMIELAEQDIELNFSRMLTIALDDADADVRALSVSGLWEDESLELLVRLISLLDREVEPVVRVVIVQSLERYAYRASIGAIDPIHSVQLRSRLLDIVSSNEAASVRRLAVESLGYFSDDQEIDVIIEEAYASPVTSMQASALVAMGRNLNDRWFPIVVRELASDEPDLRLEAARSAAEFADPRSVDALADLLADEDRDIQLAAIYALGQIGTSPARDLLRYVIRSEDPELTEHAREALDLSSPDKPPVLPH